MLGIGVLAAALVTVAAEPAEPAPPPVAITVTPTRPRLVLGTETELQVAIELVGPGAETFTPVRAIASVGTIETPTPAQTPRHFSARYLAPGERFPQVALLVVEFKAGARSIHGTARVALDGSTTVPFRTSPGAAVSMRVGERVFGPVVADKQGQVTIPIQVPPGVRTGLARAVDQHSGVRETEVDLQLPPFPRIVVLAPAALDAGSFAEIRVLAVEPNGSPSPAGKLTLTASDGLVHPLDADPSGAARFLFEAPRRLAGGTVALTAAATGSTPAQTELAVALRTGPPVALTIAPSKRRLIVGDDQSAQVTISARDAFGNPTSVAGVKVLVDGQPRPFETAPGGIGMLHISAPPSFDGRDQIAIEARLAASDRQIAAAERIRLTGGPPTRLTIEVKDARLVADGHQSTEVRVRAVDGRGTPTMVPGLSWDTPGGRVRSVRVPRNGEYLAEYVPDRTREPHRDVLGVMASSTLRADASLEVTPPPVRLVAGARAGLFHNLGGAGGPTVFVDALIPLRIRRLSLFAGLAGGYMRSDFTARGLDGDGSARLQTDQFPLLAVARARHPLSSRFDAAAELGAGYAWASTRIASSRGDIVDAAASAPGLVIGAEGGVTLRPGRLIVGLRYLWIDLGRTSQGDRISGNSAGLIGDIGYRITF